MIAAEGRLWHLQQDGRRLERYVVEFQFANWVSWHDATLGVCFQLGLNDETLCYDLPVIDFPLIERINLILYLNCSDFEVEEIGARLSQAHFE